MTEQQENDELTEKILAFFKETFGVSSEIGPAYESDDPYAIQIGGVIAEISGKTRVNVAIRYFNHVRSHHRFVAENERSGPWIDGGRKYKRKEKERAKNLLEKFDAWARDNLPNELGK